MYTMTQQNIRIFNSVSGLAGFFAGFLQQHIDANAGQPIVSVALSGGSTPRTIFEYMAANPERISWDKLRLFWGDERCVGPGHSESNYRMVQESLLKHVAVPDNNVFRIKGEADPAGEAARYASVVSHMLPDHGGIPRFDLVMLGMGDDGHTASIFPGNRQLLHSNNLFEPATHPTTGQKRITATLRLINTARNIVFLVTGAAKADMLARVIKKKEGWELLPAAHVQAAQGKLLWLLDEDAASLLG